VRDGAKEREKKKEIDRERGAQFHQRFKYNFYARRFQKRKKIQLSHKYLFTLSGSASVKAVRRALMKLSQGDGERERGEKSQKCVHSLF